MDNPYTYDVPSKVVMISSGGLELLIPDLSLRIVALSACVVKNQCDRFCKVVNDFSNFNLCLSTSLRLALQPK